MLIVCVRARSGDSMADIRETYRAKQAAGKIKRTTYDETQHRDRTQLPTQIRAYPLGASTAVESTPDDTRKAIDLVMQNKKGLVSV
jgi:predicted transcriptional regulator